MELENQKDFTPKMWSLYFLSRVIMSKYIISHQLRMNILKHEDFWLNSPEILNVTLFQTDNPSDIAYPMCANIIEKYFDIFYGEHKLSLICEIDKERVRENYSVPYAIYQTDYFGKKIFVGWWSVEIYDTIQGTPEAYLKL
jgi:hypothetical protein